MCKETSSITPTSGNDGVEQVFSMFAVCVSLCFRSCICGHLEVISVVLLTLVGLVHWGDLALVLYWASLGLSPADGRSSRVSKPNAQAHIKPLLAAYLFTLH